MDNYYIDTHVHLNDQTLYSKLDEVLKEARENNVKKFFVVGWDLESSKLALKISHQYEDVYAVIGFHPCNIRGYSDFEYQWLEKNALDDRVVAVGEIGFDFHWQDTTKEEQTEAFIRQIEIAKRIKKPLSIHSREADQLTFDILKKYDASSIGGVLHCYSGSYELAKEYVKMNFIFGVDGPLTFKNNHKTVEVVEKIDLQYLISETDSPYLTPHPYRGKENGPKYLPLIVEKIAEIKKIDVSTVQKNIIDNVRRVFKV